MGTNPIAAFGVSPPTRGLPTNLITLTPGTDYHIPSGTWQIYSQGQYISIQQRDQITRLWQTIGAGADGVSYINSDGVNYRVVNQTGCVVGAYLTNAGTGYTSAPTVSAGTTSAASFTAITSAQNHMVSTSVTVTSSGTGYTYDPIVVFDAPPINGLQATGYATLTSGVITVTVVNQGGGYTNAPNVYFINDSRDSTGQGASAVCTLTGAGTIAAVITNDFGNPVSAVPSITFTGGGGSSAAATAILNYVISAYTVTSAGSGYAGNVIVTAMMPPINASNTNPSVQANLLQQSQAWIQASLWGGSSSLTATGQTVFSGGNYPGVPTGFVMGWSNGSAAQVSFTGSGVTDTVSILPV
jgi:hypothetical protein